MDPLLGVTLVDYYPVYGTSQLRIACTRNNEEHPIMKAMSVLAGAGLMAMALQAMAHGGGLDASGCHHSRKTGDYHCHRTPAVPAQPPSGQANVGDARSSLQQPQASITPREPTCHVGPRGGTYTITSSGRKNYGGC